MMTTSDDNKVTMSITTEVEVPFDRIACMLCTAIEGGIGYWAKQAYKDLPADPVTCKARAAEVVPDWADFLLYAAPFIGGSLTIVEAEHHSDDRENVPYVLTLESLIKGLQVMQREYPRHFADLMAENDDSITGDVFVQCCCFGELIYG